MKSMRRIVLCLVTITALLAVAQTSTPFSGYYQASNTSVDNGQVQLTFSAQVSNNSGHDVANATISLIDPLMAKPPYATFSGISITNGSSSPTLTQSISIPKYLYDSWQNGGNPQLTIDFTDASGTAEHIIFAVTTQPPQ